MADRSHIETYAIWKAHGGKCGYCKHPVPFAQVEIDHILPRSLSDNPAKLTKALFDFGLPPEFNIEGYENAQPSHTHCNRKKSNRVMRPTLAMTEKLGEAFTLAAKIKKDVEKLSGENGMAKIVASICEGLASQRIGLTDLMDIVRDFLGNPDQIALGEKGIVYQRTKIVAEGYCECPSNRCFGHDTKLYIYFTDQPEWVVSKGLCKDCYDEIIACKTCGRSHKRGHIKAPWVCLPRNTSAGSSITP